MREENTTEKMEAGEIRVTSGFLKKLDNFWYHYKWPTIIIAFFLIVFLISFVQCAKKEDTDLMLYYAGSSNLSESQRTELTKAVSSILPEDLKFAMGTNLIYTEAELDEMYSFYDEEHDEIIKDLNTLSGATYQNQREIETFSNYVKTGDCALFFVSPYVYELLNLSHFSKKASMEQEVRLGDTEFYNNYDAVKEILPADTLIVLTDSFFTKDDTFALSEEVYQAIVTFSKK